MQSKTRKLKVAVFSIAAVIVLFFIYTSVFKTPRLTLLTTEGPNQLLDELEIEQLDSNVGKVGDVSIGAVEKALYKDRLDLVTGKFGREFGFARLLHSEEKEWLLDQPFMNIYRDNLTCKITADKGFVEIETGVGGNPVPRDSTLMGNVVIKIIPQQKSDVSECTIYFDRVDFISERSEFSTDGLLTFVSKDAVMNGKGMRLIFDEEKNRLDFFRIIDLHSLKLRTDRTTPLEVSSSEAETKESKSQKDRPVASASSGSGNQGGNEFYRCIFDKNVFIETPDQFVYADELFVENILFSESKDSKSKLSQNKTSPKASEPSQYSEQEQKTEAIPAQEPETAPDLELSEDEYNITVLCDGGITVVPMVYPIEKIDYLKYEPKVSVTEKHQVNSLTEKIEKAILAAKKITYNLLADEASLIGNSYCKMAKSDINGLVQIYSLKAPEITAIIAKDESGDPNRIKRLTATGETVQLAAVKLKDEQVLSFVKLKCFKFDYFADEEYYIATNGLIVANNSNIPEPPKDEPKFSMKRPSWTSLQNFHTLRYLISENQIIADAWPDETLRIDYIPIVKGQYGPQVTTTAEHIQIEMRETDAGKPDIESMIATGGVTYQEQDDQSQGGTQFTGSNFFYDAEKEFIYASGDENQPCLYNGVQVDGIEINMETGDANFKIIGPGMFQTK